MIMAADLFTLKYWIKIIKPSVNKDGLVNNH